MNVDPVDPPLTIKGWSIFAHPLFLDSLDARLATNVNTGSGRGFFSNTGYSFDITSKAEY